MSQPEENNLPQGTTRRNFLWKGGILTLLSTLPGLAKVTAATTPTPTPVPSSPIALELLRINNLPDNRTVTAAMATILSSPEMISLPSYVLKNNADILSAFQKDLLSTNLKMAANPSIFKSYLTGAITPATLALQEIKLTSPSYLTELAAAAEIKTVPSLNSLIDAGIQEMIQDLSTPLVKITTSSGVPAFDTVLANIFTLSQTPAFTNVTKALLAVARRSDFPAYVKGLILPELIAYIPSDTLLGLQLPIDAPDSSSVVAAFILAMVLAAATGKMLRGALNAYNNFRNPPPPPLSNAIWNGTYEGTVRQSQGTTSTTWTFKPQSDGTVSVTVTYIALIPQPPSGPSYDPITLPPRPTLTTLWQLTSNSAAQGSNLTLTDAGNTVTWVVTISADGNTITGSGIDRTLSLTPTQYTIDPPGLVKETPGQS